MQEQEAHWARKDCLNNMHYGVQLYGCSKEFRRNTPEFFNKMRHVGILQIEPCVLFDDPEAFRTQAPQDQKRLADDLWKPWEIPVFKKQMEGLGLSLSSVHVFASSLTDALPGMVQYAEDVEAYVVNTPEWAVTEPDKFAAELTEAAGVLERTGTQLWLHNSGKDSLVKRDYEGKPVPLYLYILKRSEKVFAQVDTGWIIAGGNDPADFIKENAPIIKGVHFKDMAKNFREKSGDEVFAVLGEGCVDIQGVLGAIPDGIPLVIDQDMSRGDFIKDLEKSARALYAAAMPGIKCVIFDVDGTLLDSMPMWYSLASDYAELKGIRLPDDAAQKMNSMSMTQCAEFYRQCGAAGTADDILLEIIGLAKLKYRESIEEVPGACRFLKALRANGIHIALATASHVGALTPALERTGMMEYIDLALCCEDIGASKEHPDIFIRCAEEFGAEPWECAVVEDSLYSAKTAKNAGFRIIGINDECHSPEDRAKLREISDMYIYDYNGLVGELNP